MQTKDRSRSAIGVNALVELCIVLAASACSSSSADSAGGVGAGGVGAGGGGAGAQTPTLPPPNLAYPCALALTVSGGLTASVSAQTDMACGFANNDSMHWESGRVGAPTSLGLYISFTVAPSGGETGTLAARRLFISNDPNTAVDADESRWEFDASTCMVVFDSNVSAPTSTSPNRWVVAGHGSCSGQGTDPTAAAAPISLSPFAFTGFIVQAP